MVPERYVLGVWSSALLVPWAVVFVARPGYRRALVWSSLFAVPFGFSEILFAGRYWSPPSLFGLAERIRLDLESFVLLFGAGGVAAVVYNVVTGRPIHVGPPRRPRGRRGAYEAALAAPALVFPLGLFVFGAPITAGVVAMAAGAIARVVCRPDLLAKTTLGSGLFTLVYLALFGSLAWIEPAYVERVWSHDGWILTRVAGVPVAEVLFGATFGAYWSGLYEHWRWTFAGRSADEPSGGDAPEPAPSG